MFKKTVPLSVEMPVFGNPVLFERDLPKAKPIGQTDELECIKSKIIDTLNFAKDLYNGTNYRKNAGILEK